LDLRIIETNFSIMGIEDLAGSTVLVDTNSVHGFTLDEMDLEPAGGVRFPMMTSKTVSIIDGAPPISCITFRPNLD
ncbi:MAG: hypothetical protein WA634_07590, partial [Silvibacterium sp.]